MFCLGPCGIPDHADGKAGTNPMGKKYEEMIPVLKVQKSLPFLPQKKI